MYISKQYYQSQQHFLRLHGDPASLLLPLEIEGQESISIPFSYKLTCLNLADDNTLSSLHGKMLCCEIGDENELFPSRFINGVITHITFCVDNSEQRTCTLTLQPELAKLATGRKTRVWSNITIPDIVSTIFRKNLFHSPDIKLYNVSPLMEYKIQYRESDLDFINRILTEVGIYYFFIHNKNSHIMMLSDNAASHQSSHTAIRQHLSGDEIFQPGYIWGWSSSSTLKCANVSLSGYKVDSASEITIKIESSDTSINSSKCNYEDIIPDGDRDYITQRAESIMASHDNGIKTWSGETCSWWLVCGERFTLVDLENNLKDYLITTLYLRAANNYNATTGELTCKIGAADNLKPLPPTSEANKPVIPGVLLARVVGPESEDIYTDKYGRVKIRFLWGEETLSGTEKTSCWVRVSQLWSGLGFGSQFIPRIGSEVLVSFIQGDPDYPVVVGSVYNGQNNPPFSLSEKNKSGFITCSANDGDKWKGHQLLFDDKKGKEKTTLSSSGDFQLNVNKDMVSNIDNSLSLTVSAGRNSIIKKGNDVLEIKEGDLLSKVTGNMDIKISNGNYSLDVSGGSGNIVTNGKLTLESTQSVRLKVGTNEITISASEINIKGTTIKLEGVAKTEVKGTTLKLEGQAVTEVKGTVLTLQGEAMTQVKGGLINIG